MKRHVLVMFFALSVWVWPASTVALSDAGVPPPADAVSVAVADVPAASTEVSPEPKDTPKPKTEPETVDKVPETPEEVSHVFNAFITAAQEGHWAIFAGLALMLVIWILRRLNILAKIPAKAVPWVAAALGIAGYMAVGLAAGMVWYAALGNGFLTGASATGFWELIFKHLLKKPKRPAEE